MQDLGGGDEDLGRVLSEKLLRRKLAELIMSNHEEQGGNIFSVVVNHNKSFSDMVKVGDYDWVNEDITAENFPVEGSGEVSKELHLIHFNRRMSSNGVLAELEKLNLSPGKIEDLLALGIVQPELQRQFPIVALGSVWRDPDGNRRVPGLWSTARGRGLRLYRFGRDWGGDFRFLAVSKPVRNATA